MPDFKCICDNEKTYRSFDLSTNCPKRKAGNPCPYCYVESGRNINFNAKLIYETTYNHDVLRLKDSTVLKLNNMEGLRMFSFGDYMEYMDKDLVKLFDDADLKGLKLKAITKVPEFIHKFHDRLNVVHISVDTVGSGCDWEVAKQLRSMYPNVRIRGACMSDSDVAVLAEFCDLLNLNHARNKFHKFTPKEKKFYFNKYPDQMCCQSGKCESCNLKCKAERR